MATKKIFPSKSSASLTPWLGIAFIIVLIDQLTKITITRTFQRQNKYKKLLQRWRDRFYS